MRKKSNLFLNILVIAGIVLFILIAIFKNELAIFVSDEIKQESQKELNQETKNKIITEYIYKDTSKFEYTFLEFGAKGCLACRKMVPVMQYIDSLYPNVNVVFHNLRKKESNIYADFFGVVMIPTQIILDKNGNEIFRHTGYISQYDLEKLFKTN